MKKFLALIVLALAMVACGEKQDPKPVQAVEETVVEEVTPATPEEIKQAEEASKNAPVQAVEETVEEEVQAVVPADNAPATEPTKTAQ
ncbi:MAG: hypothetical protein RR191_06910 [Cetobacterium sp.]